MPVKKMKTLSCGLFFVFFVIGCSPLEELKDGTQQESCTERTQAGQYLAQWKDGSLSMIRSHDIHAWRANHEDVLRIEPSYRVDLHLQNRARSFNEGLSANFIRQKLGVYSAWHQNFWGQGITVAVVDSGVDTTQSFLNGRIAPQGGWNFVDQSAQQNDEVGHGTAIASIITGPALNAKSPSMAPDARILPLDFMTLEGGSEYHAYQAIEYAINNGAQVINNSWSIECSQLLTEKFKAWQTQNVIFVNAAGNAGLDLGLNNRLPASLNYPRFLNVGSLNDLGKRSFFSNFGPSVQIYAPGEGIPIVSIYDSFQNPSAGTSLSAGIISGGVALVWSAFPTATAAQILELVLKNGIRRTTGKLPQLSIEAAIEAGHNLDFHNPQPEPEPTPPPLMN